MVRTVDLMKKGLRRAHGGELRFISVRTVDLMKKGLRLRFSSASLIACVRTVDLMKKGLRPVRSAPVRLAPGSEP